MPGRVPWALYTASSSEVESKAMRKEDVRESCILTQARKWEALRKGALPWLAVLQVHLPLAALAADPDSPPGLLGLGPGEQWTAVWCGRCQQTCPARLAWALWDRVRAVLSLPARRAACGAGLRSPGTARHGAARPSGSAASGTQDGARRLGREGKVVAENT